MRVPVGLRTGYFVWCHWTRKAFVWYRRNRGVAPDPEWERPRSVTLFSLG